MKQRSEKLHKGLNELTVLKMPRHFNQFIQASLPIALILPFNSKGAS